MARDSREIGCRRENSWEKAVADADEARLKANASLIAHIGTHNAYHIGQIIYVRKSQGTWDASNGVK